MAGKDLQNVGFDRDVVEGSPEDYGDGPDFAAVFKTVLQAIRRNIVLIGAILLGTMIAGVGLTLLITPKYKANARVLIEDQADQIIEGSELQKVGASWDTDRFLKTQLGIIQSRSLARLVVQSGGLDRDPQFFEAFGAAVPAEADTSGKHFAASRQESAVNILLDGLQVDLPPDSRIATIIITSRDAHLAEKVANLYADRFVEYNLNQKYQSSAYARRFLGDQLSEARAKLTQSERDLNCPLSSRETCRASCINESANARGEAVCVLGALPLPRSLTRCARSFGCGERYQLTQRR